jgi:hypothetical protein
MIVHRFMSEDEYRKLIKGERLVNVNPHFGQKTTSMGFCFFIEQPKDAIHWLSGIVIPEVCVTLEFPEGYLKKAYGYYRDVEKDKNCTGKFPPVRKAEYCCTEYSIDDCKVIAVDKDSFIGYSELTKLFRKLAILN